LACVNVLCCWEGVSPLSAVQVTEGPQSKFFFHSTNKNAFQKNKTPPGHSLPGTGSPTGGGVVGTGLLGGTSIGGSWCECMIIPSVWSFCRAFCWSPMIHPSLWVCVRPEANHSLQSSDEWATTEGVTHFISAMINALSVVLTGRKKGVSQDACGSIAHC